MTRGWSTVLTVAGTVVFGLMSLTSCYKPDLSQMELPPEVGANNAYVCDCSCLGSGQDVLISPTLTVCYPPGFNPLLGGTAPTPDELRAALDLDCRQRVGSNLNQLSRACVASPINCLCEARPGSPAFHAECDTRCAPEVLDTAECSNFDPEAGIKTATNTPGIDPVCLVASSDPPTPIPDPFAAGVFGRTSRCEVSGTVQVSSGDDSQTRQATGVVEFTGGPCPGTSCQVGMSYRIDHVDNYEFDGFLDFATVTIENIRAAGASVAGAATLDESGRGIVPAGSTLGSGKGKRINDGLLVSRTEKEAAYLGTNSDPLHVTVAWAERRCSVSGALFGTFDEADTTVAVDLQGALVNQPPTANPGPHVAVQCTSPGGRAIVLDGSRSSDPDDNIALYVWRRGTRVGEEIGTDPVVTVNQPIGGEAYFLKVVDAFGQASERSTVVLVVDTAPPVIDAVTATPNRLSPPNHKMIPVAVAASGSDLCSATTCRIAGVSSNELPDVPGDGQTKPDWQITGPLTVDLRAERSGKGSGRVYTLTVECLDAAGNAARTTTTVTVPHN